MGEAEDSAHDREVPGEAVWDRVGRPARRPRIANDFQYFGKRGGTVNVDKGMWSTGGPPWVGLGGRVK